MRRKKQSLTLFECVLIFLTFIVWLYLFTGAVRKETRMERAFVLDNTGQVVEVYTQEMEEFNLDRKEGLQK